jgi:hypothetical protein
MSRVSDMLLARLGFSHSTCASQEQDTHKGKTAPQVRALDALNQQLAQENVQLLSEVAALKAALIAPSLRHDWQSDTACCRTESVGALAAAREEANQSVCQMAATAAAASSSDRLAVMSAAPSRSAAATAMHLQHSGLRSSHHDWRPSGCPAADRSPVSPALSFHWQSTRVYTVGLSAQGALQPAVGASTATDSGAPVHMVAPDEGGRSDAPVDTKLQKLTARDEAGRFARRQVPWSVHQSPATVAFDALLLELRTLAAGGGRCKAHTQCIFSSVASWAHQALQPQDCTDLRTGPPSAAGPSEGQQALEAAQAMLSLQAALAAVQGEARIAQMQRVSLTLFLRLAPVAPVMVRHREEHANLIACGKFPCDR